MTIHYEISVPGNQFQQGEVLSGLLELRFDATQVSQETLYSLTPPAERQEHPWTIILSPSCDLEWDYKARYGEAAIGTKAMKHIFLCDLEDFRALKDDGRLQNSATMTKLVRQNRDERYHYLISAGTGEGQSLPEFFIDFKRVFSVHIEYLYAVVDKDLVIRRGTLMTPWIQHLADRFTYFLGRVGLPDEEG